MLIIIAEDDYDQQALYKECITKIDRSINLIFTQNGYDLISTMADCDMDGYIPDLILLDLNMPHMDGRTALAKMKSDQKFSSVNVVILTSSAFPVDRYLGKMYRTPYFNKPMNIDECYSLLKDIVYRYAPNKN